MQTEDKKQSWDEAAWAWLKRTFVRVRRTLVCALGAAMAVGALLFMFTGEDSLLLAFAPGASWINMVAQCMLPFAMLALVVFSIVHIFRDVPRLLMLCAGSAAFYSVRLLAVGWAPALLILAAGLMLFALEAHRQNGLLRDVPRAKVKGVLLIIAGALALLWAAFQIYRTADSIVAQAGYSEGATYAFFTGFANLVGGACIAAACFMKNRPISVYYRMFFTGSTAIYILQTVLSCIALLQYQDVPALTYVSYFGNAVLVIAITALVVIHAIRALPKKAAAEEADAEPEAGEAAEAAEADAAPEEAEPEAAAEPAEPSPEAEPESDKE